MEWDSFDGRSVSQAESDQYKVSITHKRRIKIKAKVASVWGTEFIRFFAVLTVLPRTILNSRINCARMI